MLFAALSYAVSRGFQGNNERMTQQRIQALATDIISSAANVEKGVQRIQARGISENRICFQTSGLTNYSLTPSNTNVEEVFHPSGGGANYIKPSPDALDSKDSGMTGYGSWLYSGKSVVTNVGTSAHDLVAILPFLRREVCIAINKQLNVTNPSGEPPQDTGFSNISGKYIGGSNDFNAGSPIEDSGGYLLGKKAGCYRGDESSTGLNIANSYFFYYVLLPR